MKKIIECLLMVTIVISLCGCDGNNKQTTMTTGKTWDGESIKHDNFTDLGNYVIELPDYDDASILEKGLAIANQKYDHGELSSISCTAMVTTNEQGEVIIGRNMDEEVSQYPAYVYKTTYGKYKTFGITYTAKGYKTYDELKQLNAIPDEYLALIPFISTDVFNEEGLYIETNMRTNYTYLSNYGLHSTYGETTRDDGTPWSELRASTISLPQLVGQNCSTVDEAIAFIKNSYDWYTMYLEGTHAYNGWNMSFVIGDATGKYGLIEIAQDTVSFLPYQNGQGNYYITPKWNVLDNLGSGYGRLAGVYQVIEGVETIDDAMKAMEKIMWRYEMIYIGETCRADSSTNPNSYNQIIFQDDEGNPQLDWRSDYVGNWPVLDDGRMIMHSSTYENAKSSTYDPKILEYLDDAIAAGSLVIDDGSILFDVNGNNVTFTELYIKYIQYMLTSDSEEQEKLRPYYDTYYQLLCNQSTYWCLDDHNFEALKACVYSMIHTRKDEDGNYDPNGMSIYDKLQAYYGYGVEKNETYLRDDGSIWTTGLNIGVNCAQKQMKIRFWENDNAIYTVAW